MESSHYEYFIDKLAELVLDYQLNNNKVIEEQKQNQEGKGE